MLARKSSNRVSVKIRLRIFPFRGTQCDTQPDLAAAGLGPEIESAQDAQHDVNHQEDRYGVDAVELSVHLFGLFGFCSR